MLPLIFDHGRDATLRRRKLTHVYFDVQPEGLWIEGRLPLGSGPEIERVWAAVKADELGLSSGTSGHLAAREPTERGVRIDEWPLAEASLARRPAQPKSRAVALKSLPTSDFASLSPRRDYEQEAAAIYAETLMRQHKLRMNGDIPSQTAEQRAAEIYAELLQSQHKMRMAEFERSMHHDDRAEEQQVYAAMAQLKAWRVRQNR